LKRRIFVHAHDGEFVQCVSPNPHGGKFLTSVELNQRVEEEKQRADQQQQRADQEQQRADQQQQRAEQEQKNYQDLLAKLAAKGIDINNF
jgi:hypothetical protein